MIFLWSRIPVLISWFGKLLQAIYFVDFLKDQVFGFILSLENHRHVTTNLISVWKGSDTDMFLENEKL